MFDKHCLCNVHTGDKHSTWMEIILVIVGEMVRQVAPLALIRNVATNCKFGQKVAPLASVANFANKWRFLDSVWTLVMRWHHLLGPKVGHQIMSLALPYCLGLPDWHYQLREALKIIFRHASVSSTYLCQSVRPSVGWWYFWISILSGSLIALREKLRKADPNYFSILVLVRIS